MKKVVDVTRMDASVTWERYLSGSLPTFGISIGQGRKWARLDFAIGAHARRMGDIKLSKKAMSEAGFTCGDNCLVAVGRTIPWDNAEKEHCGPAILVVAVDGVTAKILTGLADNSEPYASLKKELSQRVEKKEVAM